MKNDEKLKVGRWMAMKFIDRERKSLKSERVF